MIYLNFNNGNLNEKITGYFSITFLAYILTTTLATAEDFAVNSCNLNSIKGKYVVSFQGMFVEPGTPNVQAHMVMTSYTNYDGRGNFKSTLTVNINGIATTYHDVLGSYYVNADCTGGGESNLEGLGKLSFWSVMGNKKGNTAQDFTLVSTNPGFVGSGTGKIIQ